MKFWKIQDLLKKHTISCIIIAPVFLKILTIMHYKKKFAFRYLDKSWYVLQKRPFTVSFYQDSVLA